MTDIFSSAKRSCIMASIHSHDTKPELLVRSIVHRMGFRFRLSGAGLPGRPDLVFPRLKKVIFVHGCFWHSHHNCSRASVPSSNKVFWERKLSGNELRDKHNYRRLNKLGWSYRVVWQCQILSDDRLFSKIKSFLRDQ
jgi:DNA mismatch endonuclease, patch repair protein